MHALLEHLRGRLDGVPPFHGIDDHGRGVLDFLPGRVVDVDREHLTDAQLVALVPTNVVRAQETRPCP